MNNVAQCIFCDFRPKVGGEARFVRTFGKNRGEWLKEKIFLAKIFSKITLLERLAGFLSFQIFSERIIPSWTLSLYSRRLR